MGDSWLVRCDVRGTLPLADGSVQCCVTSPPYYGLRDYGDPRQIGLEPTPAEYVARMVAVFREVRRVLREDGVLFLNLGDSYVSSPPGNSDTQSSGLNGAQTSERYAARLLAKDNRNPRPRPSGLKPKDLIGIPWRVAFALQADGWYLRSDCIWHKPNPMPESVTDRPTKAHEYVFLLTKSPRYFYDQDAERVPLAESSAGRYAYDFGGSKSEQLVAANAEGMGVRTRVIGERPLPSGSNLRTVWTLSTRSYPGAHFATFPPELPARCIRLGTSERGACPACGTPYRRLLAKDRVPTRPGLASKVYAEPPVHPDSPVRSHAGIVCGNRDPARHVTETKTVGWEPSCSCNAGEPVPCVVLDPFSGSGTTAAVARELGRVGIGLEVNPEYLELARGRIARPVIHKDNPSLAPTSAVRPMPGQLEMFS